MTPEEQGGKMAIEEREAIVAWMERQTTIGRMGSRHPYVAETLRWAAGEIRDGAHHKE